MTDKYLGGLGAFENIMLVVTMLGVLVLVYYLVLVPHGYSLALALDKKAVAEEKKAGFYGSGPVDYTAGNVGFASVLDNTGAPGTGSYGSSYVQTESDAFSGGYEPPVFWNAGSYGAVGRMQSDNVGTASGPSDDGTAWENGPMYANKNGSGGAGPNSNFSFAASQQGFRSRRGRNGFRVRPMPAKSGFISNRFPNALNPY